MLTDDYFVSMSMSDVKNGPVRGFRDTPFMGPHFGKKAVDFPGFDCEKKINLFLLGRNG